jgi:hypothetical protein
MNTLADGSLLLCGTDYGGPGALWSLRVGSDGEELEYHLKYYPKGLGLSHEAITSDGKILSLLNSDQESMLVISDRSAHEQVRRSFKKEYLKVYLEQAVPLPNGGYLIQGQYASSSVTNSPIHKFLFQIDAAGNTVW